jgi:ParB family transcriptional regulator, chromosome partitioning protein
MRSALGKGLDALISEDTVATVASPAQPQGVAEISIDRIKPNPKQPRQSFSESALAELTESIRNRGILQPLLLSPTSDGDFEIIAGERRWRAAQRAGLKTVPAVVKTEPELERFQMALIENLQREDLNPLEQAKGYQRLAQEFQMTQEEVARIIGKDRAVIANALRMLQLPPEIQSALAEGKISASHARAIAALEDAAAQQALFQRIVNESLSVRAVEEAVRAQKQVPVRGHVRKAANPAKAPEVTALEEDLQRTLTRKVELQISGPDAKKGWLRLEFYSLDDDNLIVQLKRISPSSQIQ